MTNQGKNKVISSNTVILQIVQVKEEEILAEWLCKVAKAGFPRKKEDLLDRVQNLVRGTERERIFKNDMPEYGWYRGFIRRHPSLSERVPEHVHKGRAIVS